MLGMYCYYDSEETTGGECNEVMPVVSLRSDVVKLGGTGEQGTPWTFQVTE